MASERDQWADKLTGDSGGWLTGFLADEDEFDRRSLWRLGSWGVGSVAAVIIALAVNQNSVGWRREQMAAADLARQTQQIQWIAKESQNETRRLAAAVDTLNNDRDRLYSRVTVLEQGVDLATGSVGRQGIDAAKAAAPTPPATTSSAAPTTSAAQPAADPATLPQFGPPAPAQPLKVSPTAAVAQNTATLTAPAKTTATPTTAPTATPTTTTAATTAVAPSAASSADKASTVASLQSDPPAAAPTADSPQPTPSMMRPETTNKPAPATAPTTLAPEAATTAPATSAPPAATAATATASAAPATVTAAPATDATAAAMAAPLMPAKSIMAPPDPAASKLTAPDANAVPPLPPPQVIDAAAPKSEPDTADALAAVPVQRTEFGVDLGGANSVEGLRALWRGLLKYRSNKTLADLRPIIVVRERGNGLGMQLRLVAGPLSDAAAAAKLCATLTESDRACETTVFDGQRLALKGENGPSTNAPAVPNGRSSTTSARSLRRHGISNGAKVQEPEKPPPDKSALSSILGLK